MLAGERASAPAEAGNATSSNPVPLDSVEPSADWKVTLCVNWSRRMSQPLAVATSRSFLNEQCAAEIGQAMSAVTELHAGTERFHLWKDRGRHIFVLMARDTGHMENLARAAQEQGLPAHINYAHSNNPNNTATVLAVGPAVSNAVDSITGHLRVIGSREEPGQDVQPAPEVQ